MSLRQTQQKEPLLSDGASVADTEAQSSRKCLPRVGVAVLALLLVGSGAGFVFYYTQEHSGNGGVVVQCAPFPLEHATATGGNVCGQGATECDFECLSGYLPSLANATHAICNVSVWEPPSLPCHTCPAFEVPEHATIVGGCEVGNRTCNISCDLGWFSNAGVDVDTACCDAPGVAWEPKLGCHTCPPFETPANASVRAGCQLGDLTCEVGCDEGWFSDDELTTSNCTGKGSAWLPRVGCHTCAPFVVPDNANVSHGCKQGDLHCVVGCYEGYEAVGGLMEASCNGSSWRPMLQCVLPQFRMHFLAVGDWGTVNDATHSSSTQNSGPAGTPEWNEDYNAQEFVGYLMGQWAADHQADFVLGHGDSFYWNGVTSVYDAQWQATFEQRYPHPALQVPWYNVMGNHDYGGGSNIGGGRDALLNLLKSQRQYHSPNNNRWNLEDFYYTRRHAYKDPNDTVSNNTNSSESFTVQLFMIDTNAAPNHGYNEICCQSYGYAGRGCDDAECEAEHQGGCAPSQQVVECRTLLTQMFDDSLSNLERDLKASNATWKIVNSHYSPRMHMTPPQQERLYTILEQGGVHAFFFGHTHGEGHEYRNGIHYLMNGAGGGIKRNGGDGNIWGLSAYAFLGVSVAKSMMEVRFFGFGDGWGNFDKRVMGEAQLLHCWRLPVQHDILGYSC